MKDIHISVSTARNHIHNKPVNQWLCLGNICLVLCFPFNTNFVKVYISEVNSHQYFNWLTRVEVHMFIVLRY